jgi:hypothetical protein
MAMTVQSSEIQEFLQKKKELKALASWMRSFRCSSKYREILHELVERAPGSFSIDWDMILRRGILD